MMNFLFNIFIFPIEQILSLFFVIVYRIFKNPGISILGVSFVFSIITLPLYFLAEKHQHAERDIQARMKSEIDNIKSVFFGNERFMRLAVYYRHNGYNPVYSLRSSLSVLIQVPFFIAAYHFLSNLELLKGVAFGPVIDLARSDSLLHINNFSLNLLPVIMTIINLTSGVVYTKGFPKKDKIQLYGMSLIFLVLLYNSPAALVIYWTCNNIFSLCKNILMKIRNSKKIITVLGSILCFLMAIYLLVFYKGNIINRVIASFLLIFIPSIFLFLRYLIRIKKLPVNFIRKDVIDDSKQIFLLSIITIFLLGGLVIPSSLIASSAQEFSFIENNANPIQFIINVFSQALGLFFLLPLCIYFLLAKSNKGIFTKIVFALSIIFVIDVFIFPGSYGHLSLLFNFDDPPVLEKSVIFINLIVIFAVIILLLFIYRYKKIISSVLVIIVSTFLVMGVINCSEIIKSFSSLQLRMQNEEEFGNNYSNIYRLSKNGKNVIIVFIDQAISGYIPYVFEAKPELYESFDGFIWYRNTVSFGGHTIFGSPGLYGGYEYTPLEMQARDNLPLVEKHNESILLLPKLFLDKGFKVTVTDPVYANYSEFPDLSIFKDYPDIHADNIVGKYTKKWLNEVDYQVELASVTDSINSYLISFAIFRFVPVAFRNFVYDYGRWFTIREIKHLIKVLNNYSALDILNNITEVMDSDDNTYNSIYNSLPHEWGFLSHPDYDLSNEKNDGSKDFYVKDPHFDVNIASLRLLGKWFDFLKNNDVYDNTRIIIVSDHGTLFKDPFLEDIVLPNGDPILRYISLLMIKDFGSQGRLITDNTFMTNADVPLLALKDIIDDPVNPWTGKHLSADKTDGVTITVSEKIYFKSHFKNKFNIKSNEWLHVQYDIYDVKNWTRVKK